MHPFILLNSFAIADFAVFLVQEFIEEGDQFKVYIVCDLASQSVTFTNADDAYDYIKYWIMANS